MADKRQIHVLVPWPIPDQQTSLVKLIELPVDEPFAFAISHTSARKVVVCIHSGKESEDAENWCKTSLFTLLDDGSVEEVFYEGEQEIEPVINDDWQEWSYQRLVKAKPALDPFALEFQRAYLDIEEPINQPSLDHEDSNYLDFEPVTISAKQSVDNKSAVSNKAFALDDNAIAELKSGVKVSGGFSVNATMKPPGQPEDRTKGDRIQAFGKGTGWSKVRYNESYTRVLGCSVFAEDV
jgi:hypothetical protein